MLQVTTSTEQSRSNFMPTPCHRFVRLWVVSCSALCAATAANAADGLIATSQPDWPQWRGIRRDAIADEKGLLQAWPAGGPKLLWKIKGLGTGWSSPIVVGQRIFITGDIDDDLVIFAFDLAGRPIWTAKNGQAWTGSYPGSRACCCYSAGRLYHLNAHGRLVCLEADTGNEVWSSDICERFEAKNITWALSECLLVDGSHVIVTPGGKQALMAALDTADGSTVWTTPALGDDLTSYSSPILFQFADRRVIANCSSAHGFAVDAENGELLWTVPLKNPHKVNVSTPIYHHGSIFFVTPYAEEGRLYRLRVDDRTMVADEAWRSPLDTVTGSGVVVNDVLYAAGYRKNKWWMGIDWQTGETRCQLKDLTSGSAIFADGRLYCLDERGAVGLLIPGPDRLEVAGRFQLVQEPVQDAWTHPVLLHGRLFLRYHDSLSCYDVRRGGP